MEIGKSEMSTNVPENSPKKGLVQSAKEWGQNLAGVFNKKLESERKPGEPKISIDIFYVRHATGDDLEGLKEKLLKSDAYIPEASGWNYDSLYVVRAISENGIRPEDQFRFKTDSQSFLQRMLEIISNTKKPIVFIDVPEGSAINDRLNKLEDNEGIKFGHGYFGATKNSFKRFAKKASSDVFKARADFMLKSLKPKIQELLKDYPYMKGKKEIKVLMTLGSGHTDFYFKLKNQGYDVARSFNKNSRTYDFTTEVYRRYLFDKQVNDELIAMALLEQVLYQILPVLTSKEVIEDSKRRSLRTVISKFSFQEIKEMFEGVNNRDEFKKLFEQKLQEKGLSIPKSEQELDEFLAKPLPRPNPQTQKQ